MPRRPKIKVVDRGDSFKGKKDRFRVDVAATLSATGKRWKMYFETRPLAEECARRENDRLCEADDAARQLSVEQRLEAWRAFQICTAEGFTLTAAVLEKQARVQQSRRSLLVPSVVEAVVKAKEAGGKRPHYVRDLRNRLRQFSYAHPTTLASDLTVDGVGEWLAGLTLESGEPHSNVSKNNFRRILGVCFSFAVEKGWMATNLVEKIEELPESKEEIPVFTPEQVEALLVACDAGIRPAVAIGAFAGIRPEEILNLRWSEVRQDEGTILVLGKHAKTGARRLVDIRPNLAAWLALDVPTGAAGKVVPINFRKRLVVARKAAKLAVWPRDVLRHSFASYHVALFEDAAATALQLGHMTTVMLFRHYKGVVRKPDAQRYFDIVPKP